MRIKFRITSEYLYYYILVLLLVNNWWGDLQIFQGVYPAIKPLVLGSAIIMTLALIIEESYTFTELVVAFILIVIGGYTSYLTGSKWTLYSMILIAYAKNINIEKAIKIIYSCMSVFIAVSVNIFLFQYIFVPSSLSISEDMTKYSMTFIGANEAARYWIFWFALFLYVNAEKKISIFKKLMILIMTALFFVCTRSDALIMIFAMAILRYLGHRKSFRKFVENYAGYSFSLLWIFCLIILKFENSKIFNIINKYVTGRLRLGIRGFETYGVSIFGQSHLEFLQWVNTENYGSYRLVVDNAYYMIMIQYGTFYLILISFLFFKAKGRLDFKSSCCLIVYAVFALAENTILSPTAIFPVIIAANLSWKAKKERAVFYDYARLME